MRLPLPTERFAGQYTDAETGFQYLRARYYDPATGQFLSRDPMEALTRSAYGYVDGNPLNGTDPTGLVQCSDPSHSADEYPGNRCPDDTGAAPTMAGEAGNAGGNLTRGPQAPCTGICAVAGVLSPIPTNTAGRVVSGTQAAAAVAKTALAAPPTLKIAAFTFGKAVGTGPFAIITAVAGAIYFLTSPQPPPVENAFECPTGGPGNGNGPDRQGIPRVNGGTVMP